MPNQITERQNQYAGLKGGVRSELGLFAQDKWTVKQLTVNAGLRFDYNYTGWERSTWDPGRWCRPGASISPTRPGSRSRTSRRGSVGAYDIFGNGKTAVKANIGKYGLAPDPTAGNPISTRLVNRVTRSWTDANGNFVPDCDLINPLAQSPATTGSIDTCGQISDLRFGTPIPSTSYDPAILGGWNVRPNNWEFSTSVQHEIVAGLGVDVGYFRRSFNNFTVTQNRAVIAGRLHALQHPGAGRSAAAEQRPDPGRFLRRQSEQVRPGGQLRDGGDNFGGQTEVFNGFDFSANARTARSRPPRRRQHRQGDAGRPATSSSTTQRWPW